MNYLLIWSLAFPNISAQRVFVCIYQMLGQNVGQLRDVTYESLVVELDRLGLKTERGKFTQRTVSSRLKELVKCGLASVEKNTDGTLNITLFQPSDVLEQKTKQETIKTASCSEENEVEPATKTVTETVTETETVHVGEDRAYKEYINNTQENKQIKPSNSTSSSHSIDALVGQVDFDSPKIRKVREYIARAVYEEGLHADLVDRATAAIARGLVTKAELDSAIREAKERKRQLQTTNGFKGAYHLWETFALKVKSWFDAFGFHWTATSFRREKQPSAIVNVRYDEERILAEHDKIREQYRANPTHILRRENASCSL